jgi:hypothetical protein
MNEIIQTAKQQHDTIIAEIQNDFFNIPFGNSQFQTEMFVIAAQITPERMYRQLGLSIIDKLKHLKTFEFDLKKQLVKQETHHKTLTDNNSTEEEKKLASIEIEEFEYFDWDRKKSIRDLLKELNVLYDAYKKFPKYTEEQFERGEATHFEQRLNRQILGLVGAKESIINMIDDKQTLTNFFEQLEKIEPKELEKQLDTIRESVLAGKLNLKEHHEIQHD